MANISGRGFSLITPFALVLTLSGLLTACSDKPPAEILHQVHTDNGAYAADLSHAGLFAAVSSNQGIRLWDIQQGLPKYLWHQQPGRLNQVHIVKISRDNQVVLTSDKQSFALWNLNTGANKGYYQINDASIAVADVSNQGKFVVLGLLNGKVIHINLTTGRRIEFLAHRERISAIDMSADGQFVLSGDYAGKALLWDSETAQPVHQFNHTGRISQLKLGSQGRYLFSANSTNQSWIWERASGVKKTELKYPARQQIFTTVKFSNNGHLLATGAPNQKVKIWSVYTGELLAQWPIKADNFAATVLDFAFSEDDNQLSAETSFGVLQRWDISQL